MGREREKKGSVQQQQQQLWQAKNRADAAPKNLLKNHQQVHVLYEENRLEGLEDLEDAPLSQEADAMLVSAAENSGGASLRDQQARTKVVVRHLPPSLSEQVFLEQIESKYGDKYKWMAFYPGKISHRRHVLSRAYIAFKSPERVVDFYEDFHGHIFVSERGAQFKAIVEYAPYQRTPALPSKKDVREGTIFKDPEYMEFLEMLAKPVDYLPSAEVQLEKREVEKAASLASGGIKDPVIVTPLMEYVRNKRAAKAAPQRSNSFSGRCNLRGVATGGSSKSFNAKRRGAIRSKSNIQMVSTGSSVPTLLSQKEVLALVSTKEVYHTNREAAMRKRNDRGEVKDKKTSNETASSMPTIKGNSIHVNVDSTKEFSSRYSPQKVAENVTDVLKDGTRKEILRRKQPSEKANNESRELDHSFSSYSNRESGVSTQKHRPPVSPKVASAMQQQQEVSSCMNMAPKQTIRRESGVKFSRGAVVSSKEQGLTAQQVFSTPESKVLTDAAASGSSSVNLASPASWSERQDMRCVKNKDRPDRPVWTPRRRAENSQAAEYAMSTAASMSTATSIGSDVNTTEKGDKNPYDKTSAPSWGEKDSEQQLLGLSLDHENVCGNSCIENSTLAATKPASKADNIVSVVKEYNGVTVPADGSKSFKRAGGSVVFAANEKQMWVAKSTSGT